MPHKTLYDAIIIGGSYSGLSAAMALGRSMRNVLLIDSGQPCNRQAPHSHNFLLHDGETPAAIAAKAKAQVLAYSTIEWKDDVAVKAEKQDATFQITTGDKERFTAKKLLFATGVKDLMPTIPGFAECWGISVLHCPYCHGYEVKNEPLGIIANGDMAMELCILIHHWSANLTLFTNGASTLSEEHKQKLLVHNISIIEEPIEALEHKNGQLSSIRLSAGTQHPLTAIFTRVAFEQHCLLPAAIGIDHNEQGYIITDDFGRTNIAGVFACGDTTAPLRAVSAAVAAGTKAGAFLNKQLIEESF